MDIHGMNVIVMLCFVAIHIFAIAETDYGMCGSSSCPSEKPFCTSAGCAYRCPNNSFVNGTNCVLACNDGFVDGNMCLEKCPEDKNFTFERIALTNSFIKIRHCLSSCYFDGKNLLEYNKSCVHDCPKNANFVLSKKCSSECSDNLPFMYKAFANQTYVKCLKQCPLDKWFSRNFTCVAQCNMGELLVENSCYERCPNGSYFVYQNKCITECPYNTFKINSSCTNRCPKFIFKGSCLNQCPEESMYIWKRDSRYECLFNCPVWMYALNRQCVDMCPNDTFIYQADMSCVQTCPSLLPYAHPVYFSSSSTRIYKNNSECSSERCGYNYCNLKCSEAFICANKCPDDYPYMYESNLTCVQTCPHLTYNNSCVTTCPNATFLFNYEFRCYDACPYSIYKNECVWLCPREARILINNTCVAKCSKGKYKNKGQCVNECPESTIINDAECLRCPKDEFIFNGTCIKNCPVSMLGVKDTCIHKCPNNTNYYKNKCVSQCPKDRFSYNHTCFDDCPQSAPNKYDACDFKGSYCWGDSDHKRLCVDKCPDSFSLNFTCVENCPSSLIQYNSQCLSACPDRLFWWYTFTGPNGTCVSVLVIYGSILGSAALIVALFDCCTRYLRFRPYHSFTVCVRALLKSFKMTIVNARMRHDDYQLVPKDLEGEDEDV